VAAGDRRVVEDEIVPFRASDVERVTVQVEYARDAEVHVVKLEVFHQFA
jgi:hypothetical protein